MAWIKLRITLSYLLVYVIITQSSKSIIHGYLSKIVVVSWFDKLLIRLSVI